MQIVVRRRFALLLIGLGTIGALVGVTAVSAQSYPNRAINFVIPFPTGGGSDILGRLLAQRLAERLGQPVVVENRGGASGTIGTGRVAKATPDGYTVLFTPQTPITVAANFQQAPPYDAAKELAPVALVVISPSVVVAPATLPVRNLREFAEYARETYAFSALDDFRAQLPGLLRAKGPVFATLKIEPGEPSKKDYDYIHGPKPREAFRAAIAHR